MRVEQVDIVSPDSETRYVEAIDATEFETCCLTILDQVAATGEPMTVLKGGQPVAELRPVPRLRAKYPQHELTGEDLSRVLRAADSSATPLRTSGP